MHVHAHGSRFLPIALRILAIVALSLPLVPRPIASAQAIPNADCPSSVRITGPVDGSPGAYYSYTATATGASGLLALAIDWYQDGVLKLSDPANPSTQEFSWDTGGVKSVSVNVRAEIPGRTCPVVATSRGVTISPLPLSDVPLASYRLAAQLLEEQRAVSPAWATASFLSPWGEESVGSVTPLYRPGIVGPAYYEFKVFGPGDTDHYAGFIIVSTGEHDHPITNWATAGKSPTQRMRQEAWDAGTSADKFWKLDVLSYVAEDRNGAQVAYDGDTPPKIVSIPSGWLDNPPPMVTSTWKPQLMTGADDLVDGSIPVIPSTYITPTLTEDVELGAWTSWNELRAGYAANYAPLIAALRESAAPEWEALDVASGYGFHVLRKGESITFPLLRPLAADPTFTGEAVEQSLVEHQWDATQIQITAVEDVFSQGVPMTTTVSYVGGGSEALKVMVLSEAKHWVYLPLVIKAGPGGASATADPASAPRPFAALSAAAPAATPDGAEAQTSVPGALAADGYTYWYVGGNTEAEADAMQVWYDQYPLDGCQSGCGPTAWAMLIAWGDRRAHLDPLGWWTGRTGLYRDDGGRGDPAVMAPRWWDDADQGAGVKLMMEEINDDMGTACSGDSGYTKPWRMDDVIDYINGRSQMSVNIWWLPLGTALTGSDAQTVRTKARNVIKNPMESRRPTIVGTGWFSHYPLAYGYRDKTVQVCQTTCKLVWGKTVCTPLCTNQYYSGFLVNQGWGHTTGEWVGSDIWFAGRLTPHQSGANDIGFYRSSDDTFRFDVDHDLEDMFYFRYAAGTLPYAVRPVVGDFDRDGLVDDLAHVVRSDYWDSAKRNDWYLDYDTNASIERTLDQPVSNPGGWPVVLDHDRDGFVDDIALFSPDRFSYGWMCYEDYCQGAPTGGDYVLPVTGDFDRDGLHDDLGFYSRALRQWAFDMDHDGDFDGGAIAWPAGAGDNALPIAGDFDEDGVADDIGLFDPGYQKWWFDYNHNGNTDDSGTGFGMAGDLPFAGNFWQN